MPRPPFLSVTRAACTPLRMLAFVTVLVVGTVSATAPHAPSSDSKRDEILATARRYAELRWKATPEHVLHGDDPDGIRVDTPDASFHPEGFPTDGAEAVGMPYAWGGFTSVEEFELGLAAGRYAGHVPTTERAMSSAHAMGLDCSGFVARCWDLPLKQSTRSLGALSYELSSYDDLRPGDIVNRFDGHVALFVEFVDAERTRFRVVEAARLKVEESDYLVADAKRLGFVPMRYKPLDGRWVSMDVERPRFTAAGSGAGRFRASGRELELDDLVNPLADAVALEWARYETSQARAPDAEAEARRRVARREGDRIETQAALSIDGRTLMTGAERDAGAPFVDALIDFGRFAEPVRDMAVVEAIVEEGDYELAGRSFAARRLMVKLEGSLLMRSQLFPTTLRIECVQSDEVPLQGVIEANYVMRTDYGTTSTGQRRIGRNTKAFVLTAFDG